MKFDRFDFEIFKHWIAILPSAEILTEDMVLTVDSFTVQIHWLCFHLRWRWIKER